VIGDTVNLGSRIEGLNRSLVAVLISNAVRQEIGNVEGAVSLGDVQSEVTHSPFGLAARVSLNQTWRIARSSRDSYSHEPSGKGSSTISTQAELMAPRAKQLGQLVY